MEVTLEPIFKSALETIKNHEIKHNEVLAQKNTEIDLLNQLLEKQKDEMSDFLKVSFANKWKKKSEELEIINQNLEIKIEKLIKVNKELNYKLDKITDKTDATTQKDLNIKIKTKKATYKLDNLNLLSDENKIIGSVEN